MSGTPHKSGVLLLVSAAVVAGALASVPLSQSAGADSVSSLNAQAKDIAQELVQQQLEIDGFEQQYSVATEKVVADQRAIALTQRDIVSAQRQIAANRRTVRRLAVLTYVLNGTSSPTSGAGLFAENVRTVQATNEYASISVGNLTAATDELHTAQSAVHAQQQTLLQQTARDQAVQNQESAYLSQAQASDGHLQSLQAQVTGQLVAAVAQQQAALAAAAANAVVATQRTAAPAVVAATSASAPNSSNVTTDPPLNPYLQCVRQAESGGNYQAVSPNGLYMGAFQFSQSTWNDAAEAAGLNGLVGVPPNTATKADQDTMAVTLYKLDGERPWLGDRCST
jgi:Transglycosylase-like domain